MPPIVKADQLNSRPQLFRATPLNPTDLGPTPSDEFGPARSIDARMNQADDAAFNPIMMTNHWQESQYRQQPQSIPSPDVPIITKSQTSRGLNAHETANSNDIPIVKPTNRAQFQPNQPIVSNVRHRQDEMLVAPPGAATAEHSEQFAHAIQHGEFDAYGYHQHHAPMVDGHGHYGHAHSYGYSGGHYSDGGYGFDPSTDYFHGCGFMMDACSYFIGETLYWWRDGGWVFGGNFSGFDSFDDTLGGRFTYGRRWDEVRGWEVSFMGFDSFLANTTQFNGAGLLFGNLQGTPFGLSEAFFTSFRNNTFLDQVQKSQLFSVESNNIWFGWDVAKLFWGFRYISFEDDFRLTGSNIGGQTGLYDLRLDNHLYGLHIGGELFHDVGYRLSFSIRAKLGAYINNSRGSTLFVNNGNTVVANAARETDISYSVELGLYAHYQLLPRLRAVGGFDLFRLYDVATTAGNFSPITTTLTGTAYSLDDDATFTGYSVGIEWYR
ncbi:MAG TPA: hypothetical protein PKD64_09650 [Pirellulaceae bacterium]|nr:hypothetical protein [Pirellulaceae bacterium]HMP67880.1 hypothetical protein [Pirellulaceae bacterium]